MNDLMSHAPPAFLKEGTNPYPELYRRDYAAQSAAYTPIYKTSVLRSPRNAIRVLAYWYARWGPVMLSDIEIARAKKLAPIADIAAKVGVPADRPLLLYLCSSPFITPHEVPFVRRWIDAVRRAPDPQVRRAARDHLPTSAGWRFARIAGEDPQQLGVAWRRAIGSGEAR